MKKNNKGVKTRNILIAIGLVVLLAGGFMFRRAKTAEKPPEVLRTLKIGRGDIMSSVSGTGALRALTTVDVKSNIGGQVVEMAVDEGDTVKEGQLIARVDPSDALTALQQQEGNMTSADARLTQAKENMRMQKTQSAAQLRSAQSALDAARTRLAQAKESMAAQPTLTRTNIEQAQASFDYAQKDLQRQKDLAEKGFVAKSQLDTAEQRFQMAKAQLESAKANDVQIQLRQMDVNSAQSAVQQAEAALESAKAGMKQIEIRKADITTATAQRRQTSATLKNARTQLGYATVTAPRGGVVVQKYVEQGSIITAGKSSFSGTGAGVSIVQIADTSRMFVLVDIDETDIARIFVGQPVRITLDAYPDETFMGRVTKIAPQATVAQNVTTIPVTVEVMMGANGMKAQRKRPAGMGRHAGERGGRSGMRDGGFGGEWRGRRGGGKPGARMRGPRPAAGKTDAANRLKPGMNATCDFVTGRKSNALLVPVEAIRQTREGSMVYVMKDGKPVEQKIMTGMESDDFAEIVSGLKEGDMVAIVMMADAAGGGNSPGGGPGGGQMRGGGRGGGGGRRPGGGPHFM